jgi:hypothetical protein
MTANYGIESPARRELPMSYVTSVLQPGEIVRYATTIHWIIYLPGLLLLALSGSCPTAETQVLEPTHEWPC